ncbi:hypothetical protein KKG45_05560 [bacterium]|nr:hypothetical protein [bacterium]MBU1072697.1 hypothetical protein [bacterium]MBU1675377.1 hypothetical protein [bacterium]
MKELLKYGTRGGPTMPALAYICLCTILLAAAAGAEGRRESERHPAAPGMLVVEGLDGQGILDPVVDEGDGVRSWSWAWGALTVLADTVPVTVGETGLSLPYGTELGGVSRGRRLRFVTGEYPVDGPLLLRGESFLLFVNRGVLEVGEGRLVLAVREPQKHSGTQYLLFLGILLITTFMMMKTRARLKKS